MDKLSGTGANIKEDFEGETCQLGKTEASQLLLNFFAMNCASFKPPGFQKLDVSNMEQMSTVHKPL